MSDDLDKILGDIDDTIKKQKEEFETSEKRKKEKQESFNNSFGDLMEKTISPTMTHLLSKFRDRGHTAHIVEDNTGAFSSYIHEHYSIILKESAGSFLITIAGNYDLQKVFITFKYRFKQGSPVQNNESSFDLTEVTEESLKKVITETVNKILIEMGLCSNSFSSVE